jgi:hypothetical protein
MSALSNVRTVDSFEDLPSMQMALYSHVVMTKLLNYGQCRAQPGT